MDTNEWTVSVGVVDILGSNYRPLAGVTDVVTVAWTDDTTPAATEILNTAAGHNWRYCGTAPIAPGGDSSWACNNNTSLAPDTGLIPIVIEFYSNATDLRIVQYSAQTPIDAWVLVDDRRVSEAPVYYTVTSSVGTLLISQTDPVWHKYRICIPGFLHSVSIDATASITETAPGVQVAVVGASWVQGGQLIADAVSSGVDGFIACGNSWGEFEQQTGVDVWRCALNGTGYLNPGAATPTAGMYGSTERITALTGLPAMDLVIVFGAGNDITYDPNDVVTAANAAWTAIKAAQPAAPLIVFGAEPSLPTDPDADTLNVALEAAAASHVDVAGFFDIRNNKLITGTGYAGGATGDGNADSFISGDQLHPTAVGDRYIGAALARIISRVQLP